MTVIGEEPFTPERRPHYHYTLVVEETQHRTGAIRHYLEDMSIESIEKVISVGDAVNPRFEVLVIPEECSSLDCRALSISEFEKAIAEFLKEVVNDGK